MNFVLENNGVVFIQINPTIKGKGTAYKLALYDYLNAIPSSFGLLISSEHKCRECNNKSMLGNALCFDCTFGKMDN